MSPTLRKLHRLLGPWIFLLLLISAATGLAYRVGKKWFGVDGQTGQVLMEIHTGTWLGDSASPFYILLVGAGALFLVISGAALLWRSRSSQPSRVFHRVFATLMLLPLALLAVTGMLYQAGLEWWNFSEDMSDLLMSLHQGSWLGSTLRVYYVLLVGFGVIALGFSGLRLLLPRKLFSGK